MGKLKKIGWGFLKMQEIKTPVAALQAGGTTTRINLIFFTIVETHKDDNYIISLHK